MATDDEGAAAPADRYCFSCGRPVAFGANVCSSCGATQPPPAGGPRAGRERRPDRAKRATTLAIIGWVVAVLALGGDATLAVLRGGIAGELSDVQEQLRTQRARVKALNDRVQTLTATNQDLQSQADSLNSQTDDLRNQLSSCQEIVKVALASKGNASASQIARVTRQLVECFGPRGAG